MFVTCDVGKLWWLCGVGECGFGHLIVGFCVVYKWVFVGGGNGKVEGLK